MSAIIITGYKTDPNSMALLRSSYHLISRLPADIDNDDLRRAVPQQESQIPISYSQSIKNVCILLKFPSFQSNLEIREEIEKR
ncbi:hypothetical protein BN7_4686 [Wickerhamomyces ciferrii]|uniref:Uncharacterized protein n=1 Tax=Wickerhamomyces ciferrii (strain ATCC 14091 / BCRC 22168 / CBS 111 / JCM 3599 / NBRC 0793 / NRRL Y-1031 F-60-10) TaxID=1206466 RepID=K0KST1_WICCF|nr:uncharacterized protein BN7_4686 [Wickerhamomyces ciferrii]CCH45107.1 hypothetical protein BN7_4686 [Wickerhamomyces ciferrii]